jgi:hypothetical protein
MVHDATRSWDTADVSVGGWRSLLPVVVAVAVFVGALLILVVLVHPSAGAAGGCGGG